jgi:hypothetical protein
MLRSTLMALPVTPYLQLSKVLTELCTAVLVIADSSRWCTQVMVEELLHYYTQQLLRLSEQLLLGRVARLRVSISCAGSCTDNVTGTVCSSANDNVPAGSCSQLLPSPPLV